MKMVVYHVHRMQVAIVIEEADQVVRYHHHRDQVRVRDREPEFLVRNVVLCIRWKYTLI